MTGQKYLYEVLNSQKLLPEEETGLRSNRTDVEKCLSDAFGDKPSIILAGSMKKRTMIKDSYDLDLFYRFPSDEQRSLRDLYNLTAEALNKSFSIQKKTSAIRVLSLDGSPGTHQDFHIDVVPARIYDDKTGDAYIYQFSSADQERLKTNIQIHVDCVIKSGLQDIIKLTKLWKVRHALAIRTFVLEMLTVKFLEKPTADFESDMIRFLTTCRDNLPNARLEDPANTNNVISDLITGSDKELIADSASQGIEMLNHASDDAMRVQAWMTILRESSSPVDRTVAVTPSSTMQPPKPWSAD
jgi:hypothetical protein